MDFPKLSLANYVIPSLLFAGILLFCITASSVFNPFTLLFDPRHCSTTKLHNQNNTSDYDSVAPRDELESALARASMANKTVIIAVVNKAYADQETAAVTTMLDVFLDSFWLGEGTRPLVNHLLLVAVDQTAYDRCQFLRLNCFRLVTDGVDFGGEKLYMSEDFIKMMWRRTQFLLEVLKRGYNFIFTDTDVMWLRNPFTKLSPNKTEDLQISTDGFSGNPFGEENFINTGFYFVRSNNKTISLFQNWYDLKDNSTGKKEQDVLLELIHGGIVGKLGLRVRFLDTLYFSGFCQDSRNPREVATVHANCCRSIAAKVGDLRTVLYDWKKFRKMSSLENATAEFKWSPHLGCLNSWK